MFGFYRICVFWIWYVVVVGFRCGLPGLLFADGMLGFVYAVDGCLLLGFHLSLMVFTGALCSFELWKLGFRLVLCGVFCVCICGYRCVGICL